MLRFLSIRNFALIERLEVEFSQGLNLITGETGSGKSILVDAVALLAGRRASAEWVRSGSDQARVEGIFSMSQGHPARPLLAEAGIALEGEELIVRREISRSGANKVFLNGVLSTQTLLSDVGAQLADIHGQHDQQSLLQPAAHLDYLDRFGGYPEILKAVADSARRWSSITAEIDAIRGRERERLQLMDHLRFQIGDIDKLQLKPGLDEQLEQERKLLSSSEKRHEASRLAYQWLYEEEPSALALLDRAAKAVEQLARWDESFQESAARLASARFSLEESAFELRDYADGVEFDPGRLERVQQRLAEIQSARRKYGETIDDILAFASGCRAQLEQLSGEEVRADELHREAAAARDRYGAEAGRLSLLRRAAAERLSPRVEAELAELAMEKTVFELRFTPIEEPFSEQGSERLEFLISPNPGEPPRPLSKIASGGELSRTLLALKSILNPDRHQKTLVFDEIDAGIGGRVASVLGEKLAALARRHQVFCVTHLPQIAAAAARHFHVGKQEAEGRTRIQLQLLDAPRREAELARMLAGKAVTETTLRQARELLRRNAGQQARRRKPEVEAVGGNPEG